MLFIGKKTKFFFQEFLKPLLPQFIDIYVEPFGGSFGIGHLINANKIIYNDIETYDLDIKADEIYHLDYKEIVQKFDSINTTFYLDPPYYKKEFLYPNNNNFSHEELCHLLSNLKGKFFLSYENCRYVRELYKDNIILPYTGDRYNLRNEIIITNSQPLKAT